MRGRRGKTPKRTAPHREAAPPDAILYRVEEPVAWITLNRPEKKNALTGTMREDLLGRILEAGADASVRVLVIHGAGGAFCAGGDIGVMAGMKRLGEGFERLGRLMDLGGRIVSTLAALPKPSIASIDGVAAGAGCNLALACDVRIASSTAALGETFARVGLHPDWGGTYFLPRLVGGSRAFEMFATGGMLSAKEALALGLVSRVVPASRLVSETRALASRLAAAPPLTLRHARQAVRRSLTSSLSAMLAFERQAQLLCWESSDSSEGIQAFLEKRPPRFTGR
jgi:2-(1,2-epoxy-1,2-dihydrophenyl)acetyl-CoA isomerase